MDAHDPSFPVDAPAPGNAPARGEAPQAPQAAARHLHRERDFGVGYGNSSGYASDRRFSDGHVDPMFQFR